MSEVNAYHEAGHAFMAVYVGARVERVTIEPEWDDGPPRYADIRVKWTLRRFAPKELLEKQILVALAGPVAEMIHRGEPYHPGLVAEWSADWQAAWEAAGYLVAEPKQRLRYLEMKTAQLYRLLDQTTNWAALAAVVDELLAHETLDGEQVEDAVRTWLS